MARVRVGAKKGIKWAKRKVSRKVEKRDTRKGVRKAQNRRVSKIR